MSLEKLEKQIRKQVKEQFGESWPLVAYVVYARVTDPETMTMDEPVWLMPEDQRSFITRGMLEEALSEFESGHLPVVSFADIDDWDDDE